MHSVPCQLGQTTMVGSSLCVYLLVPNMFVLLQVIVGYAALPLSTHIQYVLICHIYFLYTQNA